MTILNPDYNSYEAPDVTFTTTHVVNNNNSVSIALRMEFAPFDFRNFRWDLYDNNVTVMTKKSLSKTNLYTNNEKNNWIRNTIYNYIPFGVCKAASPGIFNSFDSADFEELHCWDLENYTHRYDISEYMTQNDVVERDFIDNVRHFVSSDDEWYSTIFGQSFKFTYALNGNTFFSLYKPSGTYEGFDSILEDINSGDIRKIKENTVWKPLNRAAGNHEHNIVEFHANIDIYDGVEQTFAVVAANPFSREIYTHFIYSGINDDHENTQKTYEYETDSAYISNANDKLGIECTGSQNNIRIKLRKNNIDDMKWNLLNPRISFKIKKP